MFANVEINAIFIVSQIVGFIATGFAIASFQAKKRMNILALQTVVNFLWAVHYFMLGEPSAIFANLLGTARNLIYGLRGKYKFADSIIVPIVAIAAFIVTGIFTYSTPFDILPTLAMVFASIAFFVKDEMVIRYISLFISTSWIIFGVYAGSIPSIISDGCILISITLTIFRYRVFKKGKSTLSAADITEKIENLETESADNIEEKI